jgi:hypothetical protein
MSYLSRKSAAKYLDVSVSTFDEYRSRNPEDLEAYLVAGVAPRWTEEQLDRFAAKVRGNYSPNRGRRVA